MHMPTATMLSIAVPVVLAAFSAGLVTAQSKIAAAIVSRCGHAVANCNSTELVER